MKTQLLEDFAESHSQAAIPTPAQAQAKKPGVWRARVDRVEQEVPPTQAPPAEPPPRATFDEPPPTEAPAPKSLADDAAWLAQQQPAESTWFDRWGRRVATSTLGVVIVGLLAGGAWWAMRERALDQTLAVVATTAHAQRAPMAVAPVAPSPPPAPASETPAAASAPPELIAQAPPVTSAPTVSIAQAPPSAPAVASPAPVPEKPSPLQTVAKVEPATPAARASTRNIAKHRARPPLVVAEHKEPPLNDLQETLRLCRAAGYHTTQCLKRGCVATKFGLACKG